MKILADEIDKVEKSDLGSDAVAPLLHLLTRSKTEIEGRQKLLAPVAAQRDLWLGQINQKRPRCRASVSC